MDTIDPIRSMKHWRQNLTSSTAMSVLVGLGLHYGAHGDVVPVQAPLYPGAEQTDARLIYVGQGSAGGRLVIDNHAYFMATRDETGTALNWNNCGTFKWSFGRFGFDGPRTEYPLFEQNVAGSNAVTFDGGDKLRMVPEGGALLPGSICDGSLSVELWVRNPSVESGELLVRIEDGTGSKDLSAANFGMVASTGWQHLVAVSNGAQTTYYRNNSQVGTGPALSFTNKAIINLGVKSLTGSLAAVRFHSGTMNTADIAHNFQGGVALGTYLFYCMDAEQVGKNDSEVSVTLGDPFHPAVAADRAVFETERFRSVHAPSKNPNPADDINARIVSSQLPKGEEVYHWLAHRLALHMPIVSTNEHMRGDGRKYKINHGNGYGGSFMGINGGIGFGWGITYAGYMNPHELVHGTQAHQMNILTGHWWETHANFPTSFANTELMPSQGNPVYTIPQFAHSFPSSGGNYYQAFPIWEHLEEVPEYGALYSTRLWNSSPGKVAFPPKRMEEIDPDPATSFTDEWVKMAARTVRWDFPKHPEYAVAYGNTLDQQFKHNARKDRTLLLPVTYLPAGWYEPPAHRAPQQHGYNLCPLVPNVGTVTAELSGLIDTERGSHWKAMFMAVASNGSSRYGSVFATGAVGSFQVLQGDRELYLVVAAVPTKVMEINIASDYRAENQDRFPYRVRLTSTTPSDALFRKANPGAGGPHSNGGGFVAGTAQVDSSAYVAPGARVLGHAKVLGNSRIEGNAVVSGYAIIDNSFVKDNARVGDFALLEEGSSAIGNSRLMEHARVMGNTTISDHAVCKGNAHVFGPVSGSGMVDGDYVKGNNVTKGIWLNWSWGTGQNAGELDVEFNQLFLEYQFEKDKAYRVWDTNGVTYGHMIGNPSHVGDRFSTVLQLDGVDDFLDLPQSVAKHDEFTFELDVKWNGGAAGQSLFALTNPTTGNRASLVAATASGRPEFSITVGGVTQTVTANSPLPAGVWSKVQLIGYADTVGIYVNDALVGSGTVTHDLEDVDAARVYVGRGPDGGFLNARIDNLRVWSRALIEQQAPTPNPPGFLIAPVSYDGNRAIMQALAGSDGSGPLEYFFDEVSGNPGGSDSGWQTSSYYMDGGLSGGTNYSYRVKIRDAHGNETAFSGPVSFTTPTVLPAYHGFNAQGEVVIEAESFDAKTQGSIHTVDWLFSTAKSGYSGTGGMYVPDQGRWVPAGYAPTASPRMDYRIKFDAAGTYYLSLRGWGNNGSGASCHAGINMQPVSELSNIGLFDFHDDRSYSWILNRPFTIPAPGIYMLNLWMRDDGAVIDKLMISGAQIQPSGVGPGATPAGGGETVAPPESAPSSPGGLTGASGINFVDLSWNQPTGAVIGYHVYRSRTPGGPYSRLTGTPLTNRTFRDTGASSTQANYYVVTAVNSTLGESPASAEISVTAQVDLSPSAPTGLVVQSANGFIRVNWNNNPETDLAGYRVYRSATQNDGYLPVTPSLQATNQFFDIRAVPGLTYWYRVIAFDTAGAQGAPSSTASGLANPPSTNYTPGTAVSINLGGNGSLTTGDQAGFNAVANWNDFTGVVNPSAAGLFTSDNGIVPMSFSASGGNDSFNTTATPNMRMYGSMLFGAYANLTAIPFSRYQLVIYYNSWANETSSSVIRFDLAGDDGPITSAYGVKKKSFNGVWDEFGATTMEAASAELQNGDGGFYLVVDGLTDPNLQISTTTISGQTGAISGIQIIAQENLSDADADGLNDAWETSNFGNLNQVGTGDPDSDGHNNEAEETAGTNPNLAASTPLDIDADGLADVWEMVNFGNLNQVGTSDPDGDGFSNEAEETAGTSPNNRGDPARRVISVNYDTASSSTPALAPADTTGVVPAANWNNVVNVNHSMTFVDDSAASTPLSVALSAGGRDSWNTLGTSAERLFGDKVNMGSAAQTLTLGNVPYLKYDLYIYLSSWGSEVVNFGINGGPTIANLSNTFTPQFTAGADFVENDTYVKLSGLTGSAVVVNMDATSDELHLAGFQIVEIPALSEDGDGDGLPDTWEIANFGNLDRASTSDDDADDIPLLHEYLFDTDPNAHSMAPVPRLFGLPGGSREIRFEGRAGRMYTLLKSRTLNSESWEVVGSIGPLEGNEMLEWVDGPVVESCFYRIRVSAP
jgi:hypothetical protein